MKKDYLSLLSIEEVSKFCFDNRLFDKQGRFIILYGNINLFIPYEVIKYSGFKGYQAVPSITYYARGSFDIVKQYVTSWKEI